MQCRVVVLGLSLVGFLAACGCDTGAQGDVPPRLPTVPSDATWAGGKDGGAWIRCEVDLEQAANWCTVWSDQTGEVSARTLFVLRGTGGFAQAEDLHYSGFNGIYIGLKDGRMLEPLRFHNVKRDPWEETPIEPARE
jgi:hypothetical protein